MVLLRVRVVQVKIKRILTGACLIKKQYQCQKMKGQKQLVKRKEKEEQGNSLCLILKPVKLQKDLSKSVLKKLLTLYKNLI